jgi:hypothetical protein
MKQINVVALKDVHSQTNRIGHNNRNIKSQSSIDVETKLLEIPSPLPLTFDIRPIHDYYFNEYTYHDVFGGIVLTTMSPEISARIVDHVFHIEDVKIEDHCKILNENVFDKYELAETSNPHAKKIVFLPGSNLMNAVDKEILDRMMFNDESVYLKLHPITSDDMIRQLGIKYGYHRILSPKESGMSYLKQADEIFTTSNSEVGIYAAALGKLFCDITSFECMAELTYWTIIRLFIPGKFEHNKLVINKVLSSKGSGWLMPWMNDTEERVKEYYDRSMKLRGYFKPLAPKVNRSRLKSMPVPVPVDKTKEIKKE